MVFVRGAELNENWIQSFFDKSFGTDIYETWNKLNDQWYEMLKRIISIKKPLNEFYSHIKCQV